jgi:glutaredoxin
VPPPAKRVVTLYSRPGCHLCEQAERVLRRIAARSGFAVEVVDIEANDSLLKRYMLEIPVLAIDGVDVASAPLSERTIEDLLAGIETRTDPNRTSL